MPGSHLRGSLPVDLGDCYLTHLQCMPLGTEQHLEFALVPITGEFDTSLGIGSETAVSGEWISHRCCEKQPQSYLNRPSHRVSVPRRITPSGIEHVSRADNNISRSIEYRCHELIKLFGVMLPVGIHEDKCGARVARDRDDPGLEDGTLPPVLFEVDDLDTGIPRDVGSAIRRSIAQYHRTNCVPMNLVGHALKDIPKSGFFVVGSHEHDDHAPNDR